MLHKASIKSKLTSNPYASLSSEIGFDHVIWYRVMLYEVHIAQLQQTHTCHEAPLYPDSWKVEESESYVIS